MNTKIIFSEKVNPGQPGDTKLRVLQGWPGYRNTNYWCPGSPVFLCDYVHNIFHSMYERKNRERFVDVNTKPFAQMGRKA